MEPTKRNPDGLISKKPIALRLMPAELAQAKKVASENHTSLSCLAREAFLKGLPFVVSSAATPSLAADLTGGEASASPAGLSSLAA